MQTAPGGPRHRAGSVHLDTRDVVSELVDLLTPKIVASVAGVKDPGQVRKWVRGSLNPTQPATQRLRFALDTLQEIESTQGRKVAQAWALSINGRLDYMSPVKAIREDRYSDVAAAAKALMEDAYDG